MSRLLSWSEVEGIREALDAHVAQSGVRARAAQLAHTLDVTPEVVLDVWAGRTSNLVQLQRAPEVPAPSVAPAGSARRLAWEAVEEHGSAQKLAEITGLLSVIKRGKAPKNVLEIGSYFGGTLWAFDQLRAPGGRMVAVDMMLLDGRLEGAAGVDYELLATDSHDPATLEQVKILFDGQPVDLLFVDGDHTLEGATLDWEMYSPLVRKGGLVAFHDTGMPHEFVETHNVIPLWLRLQREHDTAHIFGTHEDGHWGGIGVVFL